jgi:glycosyltransferase involved in cell wall biosynthesis
MYLGERINFSINTSFYKRSDCIDHIYEGLKAQTYKYWEWVVTDDFSEDKNAEKSLKEIASNDHRVVYYTQSRKKELFWNPNYGASGNVIFQMDSDDTMYPNILEIYAKHFMEDPSLMGICCGCYMEGDDKTYRGYGFNFLSGENCLNMTWGRAWRNIIPHFDYEGKLQHFQNDTNIIRHIESRGKVLSLPRELYIYNWSEECISKAQYFPSEVEDERSLIEGKFGINKVDDKCTFDLKYIPIENLASAFLGSCFNKSVDRKKILLIKSDIKPYEKQLLNELFYDHTIVYNGDNSDSYDEIIVYMEDEKTRDYLYNNILELQKNNKEIYLRWWCTMEDKDKWENEGKWDFFGRYCYNTLESNKGDACVCAIVL